MIRIERLCLRVGSFALRDLSLEVRAGEIVTLIGANGAGKTTTLKTVSGVVPARAVRIYSWPAW